MLYIMLYFLFLNCNIHQQHYKRYLPQAKSSSSAVSYQAVATFSHLNYSQSKPRYSTFPANFEVCPRRFSSLVGIWRLYRVVITTCTYMAEKLPARMQFHALLPT